MLANLVVVVLAVLANLAAVTCESARERAQEMLGRMTLEEKVTMLHGSEASEYIGFVAGNERLGIKAIRMNDGPQGFRAPSFPGSSTAFPAMLNLGATWDAELSYSYGQSMGREFRDKGANVALGPGMNLARVPVNGRVFEYISGGDGYLGSHLVGPVIKGIQSNKVIANAKHWVNNNQETNRATVSEVVDERTRHELYYEPFQGAVDAGIGSFMCSYNKINSVWSCENPETLGDLKKTLGFQGWVMSDWGATHSTSILAGLDQEMPSRTFFGPTLIQAVQAGTIPEAAVDDSVLRILTPMYEIGVMDDTEDTGSLENNVKTPEHTALARKIAAASHVLLQNTDNALPIKKTPPAGKGYKIALIGAMARMPIVGGGGSGQVYPSKVVTPYEGIMTALNMADQIVPMQVNCNSTATHKDIGYQQPSCISFNSPTQEDCSGRCATFTGCAEWTWIGGREGSHATCLFVPTKSGRKPFPGAISGSCMKTQPTPEWQCNAENVCLVTTDGEDVELAKKFAKEADVTVLPIGTSSGEGNDRESLSFSRSSSCQLEPESSQDALVAAVSAVAQKSVVAMVCPGACLTPWKDSVHSILHGFFPGETYGNALADVLFGEVNPSAKLPITMPNIENEVQFTESDYPGVDKVATYSEGMLIDYRWYTSKGVTPAFSFGHGLSYTIFSYSALSVSADGRSISCIVKNSGSVAGSDVAQLYLKFPAAANPPPLQLKGFVKTSALSPGAEQTVTFVLRERDLSVWDSGLKAFTLVTGEYEAKVGSSSTDLKLAATLQIAK